MANIICKECQKAFENDILFHKHLRSHKLTQTVYYQTHFPRYDRYNGAMIKFKNKAYYFDTEFNTKSNFKNWLISVSREVGLAYTIDFLSKRKDKKKLIYAPTQIELKTLMVPGIKYIDDKFGGYDSMMEKLGLKTRFKSKSLNENKFKDVSKKVIFADSREQTPLSFDNTTKTMGMSFGDYRMAGSKIFIERKSLGDAWGTLTGGFERFEREILRAKEAGAYLIILVESPFDTLEQFPLQRQVYGKIKIPVEFLYHNIRDLLQRYNHIQFLFAKSREESSRIIQKIFAADEQVKEVDLQYLLDIGKL